MKIIYNLEQASKPKAKRMKDTRLEVLRYGFKECYKQKNYQAIVTPPRRRSIVAVL